MGSSSISRSSNQIPVKQIIGVENSEIDMSGSGISNFLPDLAKECLLVALINVTNAFLQQTVGTPVVVRNLHVFANGVQLGDIPPTYHLSFTNGTHGKVYDVENGLVCLYL
jgi:hypothetical protein